MRFSHMFLHFALLHNLFITSDKVRVFIVFLCLFEQHLISVPVVLSLVFFGDKGMIYRQMVHLLSITMIKRLTS